MIARRLVIGYCFLVGMPLLGVLLILKLGEGIRALPSIQGSWVMEARGEQTPAGECASLFSEFSGQTLTVSQSGRFLAASWEHRPRMRLRGLLEGDEFTLLAVGRAEGACQTASLRIDGCVVRAGRKRGLDARLSVPECAACGELRLVSVSGGGGTAAVLPTGF
jgi:hypothetical protein